MSKPTERKDSLRERSPFPHFLPEDVTKRMVEDMLYTMRRWDDSDFDKRVAKAYKDYAGVDMLPNCEPPALFLHGAPGHGKTTSAIEAFKIACGLVGLNAKIRPNDNYIPSKDDAVMVVENLAGAVSNLDQSGLPLVRQYQDSQGNSIDYMTKAPKRNLAIAKDVGFYVLYFDDASNAGEMVQNTMMEIVEAKQYQSLDFGKNAYMILSGNYGTDGTYVVPPSLAKLTRTEHIHFEDDREAFINRFIQKYGQDRVADGGVLDYLSSDGAIFFEDPEDRMDQMETYACPRTWEKLMNRMRMYMNKVYGGMKPSSDEMTKLATGLVGYRAGTEFGAFQYAIATGAEPIARDIIVNGDLSQESRKLLDERLNKGHGSKEQQFAFQLGASLARNAVGEIRALGDVQLNDPGVTKVLVNFAKGVSLLNTAHLPLAFSILGNRMSAIPYMHDAGNALGISTATKNEIIKVMTPVLVAAGVTTGDPTDPAMKTIIGTLSQHITRRDGLTSRITAPQAVKPKF